MKILERAVSIFVGVLFIFSGLIKANDPVGMAIKLKEYFHVFSDDFDSFFEIFIPIALPLAVIICTLEVLFGIALLLSYRKKAVLKALLAMVVFFSFLTFYSAYFDKVTDCGCFGDAIPLTPWQSFIKDMILFVGILFLMLQKQYLQEAKRTFVRKIVVYGLTLATLLIAARSIMYLPFIDFRVYKIGNNIAQLRKPIEEPIYQYVMTKDGKEYTFDEYPSDESYEFKTMLTLNEDKIYPPISDYGFENEGVEYGDESLKGKHLIVVAHNALDTDIDSYKAINALISTLDKDTKVVAFTAADAKNFEALRHETQLAIPYYFGDEKVLKTIVRSNPGLLLLEDGVVKGKWHYNAIPKQLPK